MGAERDLNPASVHMPVVFGGCQPDPLGARQSAENLRERRRSIVQDQCDPSSKHIVRLALESALKVRAVSGHDHSVNWVYVCRSRTDDEPARASLSASNHPATSPPTSGHSGSSGIM
jgi:hypothetical protein